MTDIGNAPLRTRHQVPARVRGAYLVDRPAGDGPFPLLVGFHGYGESAAQMLDVLASIRSTRPWLRASVQALNRFYTRGDERVVGCWMTREDRELAIEDNLAYVASVVSAIRQDQPVSTTIVLAGFSQGVAMAYRAAAFAVAASGLILLAGDVPPDVAPVAARLPALLVGRGTTDPYYTEAKANADLGVLGRAGVDVTIHVFEGGHEWDDSFVRRAGAFLDGVAAHPALDS